MLGAVAAMWCHRRTQSSERLAKHAPSCSVTHDMVCLLLMWVWRESAPGGFRFYVYRTTVNARVDRCGTCYLYNIGWHPELNTFVSADDDAILRRHRYLCPYESKSAPVDSPAPGCFGRRSSAGRTRSFLAV